MRTRYGVGGSMCLAMFLLTASLLADLPLTQLQGQPTFSGGKALGYFIWKDGDTWKLRWMTFGSEHRFSGRIHLDGGAIQSWKRVDVDTERTLIAPGRPGRVVRGPRGRIIGRTGGQAPVVASRDEDRIEQETEQLIRFFTLTDNDVDGLEFKVTAATERLRFVLEIDGKPRPAEVEVGKDNVKPNEHPLVVRLRQSTIMSGNKQTVQKYMDAFNRTDHADILSCLTDDVEWVIPGMFHVKGKDAFDKEIENDAFVGSPTIRVTRMIEEDEVVMAEGTVRAAKRDGGVLNAVFCDVFLMRTGKIRHLTSYLMELKGGSHG